MFTVAETSILNSIKNILGVDSSLTVFDPSILMYINSAFSTLTQLGIGPTEGYMIENATPTWDAFLNDDPRLNSVKSYIGLRVRVLFDNATLTSFLLEAMDKQIKELEWRLNVVREGDSWTISNT